MRGGKARGWRRLLGRAGLASLLGPCACDVLEDDSCEVATEEISAVAVVVDDGRDIRASIDFEAGDRRGRGAPLLLCDTDRLTIAGGEPTRIGKATEIEYARTLPIDAGRSVEFVLERQDLGERITMEIALPAAFEILTPMDQDVLPIADDQVFAWEPAVTDGTMQVQLSEALGDGECVLDEGQLKQRGGTQVPDTGGWTLPAGTLSPGSSESCPVSYELARVALGTYPTVLARGGRIEARVERYVDVELTP